MDYAGPPPMTRAAQPAVDDPAHPTMHSTLERPTIVAATIDVPALTLEVIAGPDIGRAVAVDPAEEVGRIFVGKSKACQLELSDPLASRRHFALLIEGNGARLTDLDSTNGTQVNGVRVLEALVFGGELVRVGDTTIAVRIGAKRPRKLSGATRFGRFLGASPELTRLYPVCERLALSDVPVILEGETGTGKELLAEALHEASSRASGPFIVFDCTTSPAGLLEARLFGHERGAFTGAVGARPGVFEEASGGTLLIDEIGDLDVALQAKLLRAVQTGQVQRLGGTTWIKTDVRVLAATRRDLEREIQAGRFRDDLYYRLAVARLEIPPLRRRAGDVRLLAEHLWAQACPAGPPIAEDLVVRLESYAWPGNVRELSNAILHHAALGDLADVDGVARTASRATDDAIEPGAGPRRSADPSDGIIASVVARGLPFPRARREVMEAFEERYVDAMLEKHEHNISKAAAAAGIARRYFYTIRTRRGR
ncbi:MAG: Response regulator of zinc sigma-54-dependent two-component system [Myxococcaceae bacterium]|nr:Response regulator of zinc sigma-54-dependent two-component system [Myxococcaceae bacterium]